MAVMPLSRSSLSLDLTKSYWSLGVSGASGQSTNSSKSPVKTSPMPHRASISMRHCVKVRDLSRSVSHLRSSALMVFAWLVLSSPPLSLPA